MQYLSESQQDSCSYTQDYPKIYMERQRNQNRLNSIEKEESGRNPLDFKTYYTVTEIETMWYWQRETHR